MIEAKPRKPEQGPAMAADGRLRRSERTKHKIVAAYLSLVRLNLREPSMREVAEVAGCALRSVYERMSDTHTLRLAALDHAINGTLRTFDVQLRGLDRQLHVRRMQHRVAIEGKRKPAIALGIDQTAAQTLHGRQGQNALELPPRRHHPRGIQYFGHTGFGNIRGHKLLNLKDTPLTCQTALLRLARQPAPGQTPHPTATLARRHADADPRRAVVRFGLSY